MIGKIKKKNRIETGLLKSFTRAGALMGDSQRLNEGNFFFLYNLMNPVSIFIVSEELF